MILLSSIMKFVVLKSLPFSGGGKKKIAPIKIELKRLDFKEKFAGSGSSTESGKSIFRNTLKLLAGFSLKDYRDKLSKVLFQ